jgi:hypothetical protein
MCSLNEREQRFLASQKQFEAEKLKMQAMLQNTDSSMRYLKK